MFQDPLVRKNIILNVILGAINLHTPNYLIKLHAKSKPPFSFHSFIVQHLVASLRNISFHFQNWSCESSANQNEHINAHCGSISVSYEHPGVGPLDSAKPEEKGFWRVFLILTLCFLLGHLLSFSQSIEILLVGGNCLIFSFCGCFRGTLKVDMRR